MADGITVDEWLAELERLGVGQDAEGVSVNELVDALGFSQKKIQNILRVAIKAGRAEFAGTRSTTRIDGRPTQTPVYRLKAAP